MGSNFSDGIIDKFAEQAMDDMRDKSWQDIDTNSLILIVYAVQKAKVRKLVKQVTTPLWWLLGVLAAGGIWMVASDLFHLPNL